MSTNLKRLSVSLTKHGAYKVAVLLDRFEKDEVLSNLSGKVSGVNIERAQAEKTLAVSNNAVPSFWNEARAAGEATVKALVLLAIITSHHKVMEAMRSAANRSPWRGRVARGAILDGKEFTNFKNNFVELGYAVAHTDRYITYDLQKLPTLKKLAPLFRKLLEARFFSAGWDRKNSVVDEAVKQRIHEVLSIEQSDLEAWLTAEPVGQVARVVVDGKDEKFFDGVASGPEDGNFQFRSGHTSKKTGTVDVGLGKRNAKMTLRHNEIQTALYDRLVAKYGRGAVGTEVPTGHGTLIDVVVKTAGSQWFYEIKIAPSAKACIRQAIPQLLEYAYWDCDKTLADKLIIVGEPSLNSKAAKYIQFLRDEFGLQLFYEQFAD